jgi:hypothetical protein
MTGPHLRIVPRSWSASWAGLALGPACWALNTQINYALVNWECSGGKNRLGVIAAVLAVVSLAGALSSWVAWRRYDASGVPLLEEDGHPYRLLSAIGVASGILFAIVIVMQGIAGIFLEPCLR